MCSPPPECGPAAVANVPLTMSAKPAAVKTRASSRSSRGNERRRAPVAQPERLDGDDDGSCEQRDREQEMGRHDRPAQVARDGEVADRRLRERAEEDEQRNPPRPARKPGRPPRRQPRDERERDHDAADEPVSELDEGVDVPCGQRCPRSQPGQWRQPSPESVRRTAAPLPTISQRPNAFASASLRKRAGESSRLPDARECGRSLHAGPL